jgi:hypothetical protein
MLKSFDASQTEGKHKSPETMKVYAAMNFVMNYCYWLPKGNKEAMMRHLMEKLDQDSLEKTPNLLKDMII